MLINNTGVYKTPHPRLQNGKDIRFVVNTLAPHFLTKEQLPLIPNTGRVFNLSSAAQASVDKSALIGEIQLDDMAAYAQSKHTITVWSAQMARQHPEGPAFIAVNPGSQLVSKMIEEGFKVEGHDLLIGADILCRLSLESDSRNKSGSYWGSVCAG